MAAGQTVLVIEDHEQLNAMICRALRKAGFAAYGLLSAEEVSEYPELHSVDVFLIDWNLPGEDGASLIKRLREGFPNTGIILLTARSGAIHQIQGYSSGADLYLSKPVKGEELIEALTALTARKAHSLSAPGVINDTDVVLSRSHLHLKFGKEVIPLSLLEVKLLAAFVAAPRGLLEIWQLIEIMSANGYSESNRTLEVQISRLRKKLLATSSHPNPLPFIRGAGYRLVCKIVLI